MYPFITIFIPTCDDWSDLSGCLNSIRQLDYPREKIEIVIWDNASQDETVSMVRQVYEEMKREGWLNLSLIEWDKNEGSYIPYNLGLSRMFGKTQYILGLDADVELAPDTLKNMVGATKVDGAAVVGARSVYFTKPNKTSYGAGFVNLWTGRYTQKDVHDRINCDYVIGCCWLLKREPLERLNCFDPDYYISHWEVDFCLRAKRKGYSIIYEPTAIAKHKIPLHGTLSLKRLYYLYRNKLLVIKKNAPFPQKWISLALYSLFWLPKGLIDSIIRNRGMNSQEIKTILKGMMDGWLGRGGKRA